MDSHINTLNQQRRAVLASCRPLVAQFVADRAPRKNVVLSETACAEVVRFAEAMLQERLRRDTLKVEALEGWLAYFAAPSLDGKSLHERGIDAPPAIQRVMGIIDDPIAYGIDSLAVPGIYTAVLHGMGRSVTPGDLTVASHRMLDACYRQAVMHEPDLVDRSLPYIRWPDLPCCESAGRDYENPHLAVLPAAVAAIIMPYLIAR